tara:strand:- start:3776 stop:3898 length:123 start_codon:yes stop_codon:yes gene_type:complete
MFEIRSKVVDKEFIIRASGAQIGDIWIMGSEAVIWYGSKL